MKPRKKTKLCLQCNGVNPMSASHCAYCGGVLESEENDSALPFHSYETSFVPPIPPLPSSLPKTDLASSSSLPSCEAIEEKPLYTVFDQPEKDKMARLKEEIENSSPLHSLSERRSPSEEGDLPSLFKKIETNFEKLLFKKRASLPGQRIEERLPNRESQNDTRGALATGFFVLGTSLVLLSLFTIFFHRDGWITLSWSESASRWMLVLSLLTLFYGWKASGDRSSL